MVSRRQKPKHTKVPRGQGALRTRVWLQKDSHKLRNWVQRYKSLRATPTINEALASEYKSRFVK